MATNVKKDLKKARDLSYLNKDFDSFRSDLLEYSKIHYSNVIKDFSEAGLGGLFLDMAAYVGDVMSFYLDHQFSELSLETAIEDKNIIQHIKDAGVKIRGASPSFCEVELILSIAAEVKNGVYRPAEAQLPIVKAGTIVSSIDGIDFEVLEDIDFSETDIYGNLKAEYVVDFVDSQNNPTIYLVRRNAVVSSGKTNTETFTLGTYVPFRTITLSNSDVTEILSVKDSEGNIYYEVDNLSHDIVFNAIPNKEEDEDKSGFSLTLDPAPRRFITEVNYETGLSKIRFGSGKSEYEDEEVIEDPTDYALPLYGERLNFKINAVDPGNLLETKTLGISPQNTTLTVRYRYGGGVNHNVTPRTINTVKTAIMEYKINTSPIIQNSVTNSLIVNNPRSAKGGESRPSLEELRNIAFSAKSSQARIVNVQDLLYRVYTMPAKFGKVYRVGVSKNPVSNSILIHVVSRDNREKLTLANDTLKDNIALYINQYRLISDSYDIVDAAITNISIEYIISVENGYNSNEVISRCNLFLRNYLDTKNMHIDMPINKTDLTNLIINAEGVESLAGIRVINKRGTQEGRVYSNVSFSPNENTRRQKVYPPTGGIFEVRYPEADIKGAVL